MDTNGEAARGDENEAGHVTLQEDPLQRYRRLVDESGVGLFQTGRDGEVLWVNRTAARIVGYDSAEEFLAGIADIRDIYVDPSRRNEFQRLIEENGWVQNFEYEIRRKDGGNRWISVNAQPLPSESGITGFEGVVIDVTDRKLFQAALAAVSSAREPIDAIASFGDILSGLVPYRQLTFAVIEGDRYRRLVSISSTKTNAFPRDASESLAGNSMEEVVDARRVVVVNDTLDGKYPFDRVLHSRGVSSYAIFPLIDETGTVFATFNVGSAEPMAFDRDVVSLLEGITGAITGALKNVLAFEREREANAELERVNRLRKDLFAWVSHDLRSPLAVITGNAEIMSQWWDRLDDAEKREKIDVVVRQAARMDALLRRDLELALIEAGELVCKKEAFDLAHLLPRSVSDVASSMDSRTFTTEIEDDLPLALGDEERTMQVLGNLLSNAVKFSAEGSAVTVRATSSGTMLRVTVHNEGAGIDRNQLDAIFERMTRLDPQKAGTGLGLYISRYLVETQGGRINARSAPGEGVSISFTLPRAPS
jgi:PAS domain S-box-containing protein